MKDNNTELLPLVDETGKVIPVTIIEAGPCVVVQKMTEEKEGYNAVKITTELEYEGKPYKYGMQVETFKYGVGHSMAFRVGKAKIYGRGAGIEQK